MNRPRSCPGLAQDAQIKSLWFWFTNEDSSISVRDGDKGFYIAQNEK